MPFSLFSSPPQNYFLLVGLGNPGRQYEHTRHNVGFMAMNRLASKIGQTFSKLESKALIAKGSYHEQRLLLAKPQTFMNLSGRAVSSLMRYYKVSLANLLVTYDDVDLPFGALRLRPGGGSAGHRGMQSIVDQLGMEDFPRLRIGVGRPPGRMEAADYVLQDFDRAEVEALASVLDSAVEAMLTFVDGGLEKAMNQYNNRSS
jgi:PTH1 family peptidyl-tRNA hydrolase